MRVVRGPVLIAICVVLAGCGGFGVLPDGDGGSASGDATGSVTPAPVPNETDGENGAAIAGESVGRSADRYATLRPTCDRPPALVVHIQVLALANNDNATNSGINTTWRFAAPSNREITGPYEAFVDLITTGYRPLLTATSIQYGPLERDGDVATQRVTVFDAEGTPTSYRWTLERQDEPPYEGCWMTTSVVGTAVDGPLTDPTTDTDPAAGTTTTTATTTEPAG